MIAFFYILIILVILIFAFNFKKEPKLECPICHSDNNWKKYYWDRNIDSKTNFCGSCCRVQYHYELDIFTIFNEPQEFIEE